MWLSYLRITSTYVENTFAGLWLTTWAIGSPPHTWRTRSDMFKYEIPVGITSTYVEVIPTLAALLSAVLGVLHVCGGDPRLYRIHVVSY
jgi:hypothetical protein